MSETMFIPVESMHKKNYIKVIGVGGGGVNAVNLMYNKGIKGVEFIVCNTDGSSLDASPVEKKIQLGKSGLGAGEDPEVAKEEAIAMENEIRAYFENDTQMVFLTAGMGGGTGTGASPEIARIIKSIELDDTRVKEILLIGVVTLPFDSEGLIRKAQALNGIEELRKYVDALIVVNNTNLLAFGKLKLSEAFEKANEILNSAVKSISEIMTTSKYLQIDFKDVNATLSKSSMAMIGLGKAKGEHRAKEALEQALNSPLLNNNSIEGATNILINISYSHEYELDVDEMNDIHQTLQQHIGGQPNRMKQGVGFDDKLGEELSIAIIATGFSMDDVLGEKTMTTTKIGDTQPPKVNLPQPNTTEKEVVIEPRRPIYPINEISNHKTNPEIKPEPKVENANANKSIFTVEPIQDNPTNNLNTNKSPFSGLNDVLQAKMTNENQVASRDRASMLRSYSDEHRKREWKDEATLKRLEAEPSYAKQGFSFPSDIVISSNIPSHFLNENGQIKKNPFFDNTID
jgi:cell division protein FtsZ